MHAFSRCQIHPSSALQDLLLSVLEESSPIDEMRTKGTGKEGAASPNKNRLAQEAVDEHEWSALLCSG